MISLNKVPQTPTIRLSGFDSEFISVVSNRITLYGQIQYTIPELLIIDLIKSSARYFYKFYGNAWYKGTYFINKKDLLEYSLAKTGENSTLAIKLSQKIRVVEGIYETNLPSSALLSTLDVTTFGGGSTTDGPIGINNNLYILDKVCRGVESRAINNVMNSPIPFSYNNNTNDLYLGRKIKDGSDVVLRVWMDIPIERLYNDTYFERHVIACCKRELKRLLGGHTFELPGGVTMNADEICNGWEDAEKVEELIKAGSGVGDVILKRLG
jgi:hypothetical protein